ncbi:UDP-N-acetylmuramoyl-L-alanyl-D-glutamate--2,6-diaminopimelate ligase [Marinobacter sp. X15-166B]|uniref:UDP-N-acetylmuramoyl-L-alanyl-D-glutamate--2, 6-diaminopimelate ligase n=1 Tax=Marinobacter sp. X15-166B TaxID=1897620 RepID=UPI00085C2BF1|nr:UDP-N-acetylmuramoyl-L-alanyl-D-glutamate--2,6-diaminopimelate ligase [Marinobacter sp. X15-166B]OEY66693.1 UDP-N-acetylmuramoyl-L-alanyl-D-glutamate--2,6-diaminopimelate ligase [Marinobacter sp. X15-166B]
MCITSLSKLLQNIAEVPSVFDVTIHGLATDSRQVRPGDAFVALAGSRTPADHYIDEAIDRGAIVVLEDALADGELRTECYEHRGALRVPVPRLRGLLGKIADRFFEYPSQCVRVIGITGTNGKTSVAQYVAQLLTHTGSLCGVIGTLGNGLLGAVEPGSHTTPDVVAVNRAIARIHDQQGRAVAMEVSSHALDQGRIDRVMITGAVFTNLTRDHLDYHGSMEAYGAAKARLFAREELHFAVVNFDDPFGRQLYQQLEGKCDRVRYSLHEAQVELWLTRYQPSATGFEASVDGIWGAFDISAPLLGSFNASNLLAAMGVVLSLGVPVAQLIPAVAKLTSPPGRLESYLGANGVQVVVDYAHTPDALANALAALRAHTGQRLICVFGCGGDRDAGKRPEMAEQAERGADLVIVTDDNPRTESPAAIVADIMAGFANPQAALVIHDRAEAIRRAVSLAQAGDVVLVAGKGHESWQEVAGEKLPFSDAAHVRRALRLRDGVA